MKKTAIAIGLMIATLNAAQAQATYVPVTPAAEKQMRFLLGAGLTAGGDKLMTLEYENGTDISIRAGGMVALTAGVDYRVTDQFSIQATVGYHVDNTSARNADVRFERYPIELLAYYHVSPQWRIGAGARYASNPKIKTSGFDDIGDFSFDNAVSGVLEAEYLMGANLGIKMRYVNEKYEGKDIVGKVDGNHVGVFANYYF